MYNFNGNTFTFIVLHVTVSLEINLFYDGWHWVCGWIFAHFIHEITSGCTK